MERIVASLIGNSIEMDYSIRDGAVRFLALYGKVLLDEDDGISTDGWKEILWKWAEEYGMTVNNGRGWRAWVIRLANDLGKDLPRQQ